MDNKDKPARVKKGKKNAKCNPAQYVMFGFNMNDDSQTGYVGFDMDPNAKKLCIVVDDLASARRFPEENTNKNPDFGTPEQWLDFFNHDPSYEDWKFHLVKVKTR